MARPPAGLCDSCVHQQTIRNTRGSEFSLCRRSRSEPERYPRYPRLPVLRCSGWEARQQVTEETAG
jgi:hypothetical protein